jgi:fatty acid desaturase
MNVNLHQVHHEFPQLPWFMVNRHWQTHRQLILQRNGGYFYKGYWSLMRQTMLRQKDSPIYPKH